jgi:LPXTG-motif cell wall-anchored protein
MDGATALTFSFSDGDISGIVRLKYDETLPTDLQCRVLKINSGDDGYADMSNSVRSEIETDTRVATQLQLYRLEWFSNGTSYTLPVTIIPTIDITSTEDSDAALAGAVITSEADIEETAVFKEISSMGNVNDSNELADVNDVMLNLYSFDDVSDDSTSDSALVVESSYEDSDYGEAYDSAGEQEDNFLIKEKVSDDPETYAVVCKTDDSDYRVDTVIADDNSDSIELKMMGTSTFALLRAYDASAVSGDYYRRVDDVSEIDATKSYLLVYQSDVMAYGIDSTLGKYVTKKLEISPVAGVENSKYFTVKDVDSGVSINPTTMPGLNWNLSPYYSGDTIAGYYILMGKYWYALYNGANYYGVWQFQHVNASNAWWVYMNLPYSYTDSNGDTQTYTYLWCMSYNTDTGSTVAHDTINGDTNILIYEYVGGERNVLDELQEAEALKSDTGTQSVQMTKPEYNSYTTVSGAKEETAVLGELHTVAGATVDCTSDASTSQIESKLGMAKSTLSTSAQYEQQKKNDGRLITDKSVVYGKDDYAAIGASNYDAGDFSVALSALGQEWKVEESRVETTPMDVVFIYDVSNSMTKPANPDNTDDDTTRWMASTDAVNQAMKEILDNNPKNRVGVVEFSNTSAALLELGRYTADKDNYFVYSRDNIYTTDESTGESKLSKYNYSTLRVADDLKVEGSDTLSSDAGKVLNISGAGMFSATYTQRGLQEAYEMFSRADTTVEIDGVNEPIKRQPVIILLTDGDPTFCTYNYMDPKSGPNYGNGCSYGIEGYYTILSANYFKNMTSIHYGKTATFYTIGMGILSEGYGNFDKSYVQHDHSYMRAVLNPTQENIEALNSYKPYTTVSYRADEQEQLWKDAGRQLQRLLRERCMDDNDENYISNGEFTYNITQVLTYSSTDKKYVYSGNKKTACTGLGYTAAEIRGVANPYKDNYSYVDAAFFGNLDTEDLENIFDSILSNIQVTTRYDFLLKDDSNVVITDPLGDGMIVKGTPVLRYYGVNYTDPTFTTSSDEANTYVTYSWNKEATRQTTDAKKKEPTVDLSVVKLTVATNNSTGAQTVSFTIPESALPTFYPDNYKQFYYEELPIRAIYRVGLSLDEEAKLNTAAGGKEGAIVDKVYYTNKYNGDTPSTTVTFEPATGNPYYENAEHQSTTVAKSANTSETTANSFVETVNADGSVTQLLGNNGKLVLNRPETLDLTVNKVWETDKADKAEVQLFVDGTIVNNSTGATMGTFNWLQETAELNEANNWTYTWTGLPKKEDLGAITYYYTNYYVREVPMEGYAATYKDKDGNAMETQSFTYLSTEVSTYSYSGTTETKEHTVDVAAANSGKVTIVNTKAYKLPESGGIGTNWFALSGLIMLLTATGFVCIRRKYYSKGECKD